MDRTGAYGNLGSGPVPPGEHRQPLLPTAPEINNQAPEPLNQPLLAQHPQGYGATCTTLNSYQQPFTTAPGSEGFKPAEVVPAPENRKGDRVCVQAPNNRQHAYNPVEHLYPNNQPPQNTQFPTNQKPPRKPPNTSRTLKSATLCDNQYYLSLILCIALTLLCNPVALICCILAFNFASKAADENEKENYEQAYRDHKTAEFCNIGGSVAIIYIGTFVVSCVATFLVAFIGYA